MAEDNDEDEDKYNKFMLCFSSLRLMNVCLDCSNRSWVSRSDHQASNPLHFDPLSTDKHEDLPHSDILVNDLSPVSRSNGDKDTPDLLPEFNDLVKEFHKKPNVSPMKDSDLQRPKDAHDQEITSLRNLVKILKERESNLEIQLLEYYGLKEQETAVMELQNRLKLNNMEAKLFALKIESLQADNRRLEAQMADYTKAVSDLEAARSKIKTLKKKLRSETEQNKKQMLDFQQRVQKMQQDEHENAAGIDPEIGSSLDKLKGLEAEVEELRKSNHSLQLENDDLGRRLDCVQMLATSVLEDSETEKLREETQNLKKENEDLSKEIERLQADRCGDLEELVYLRWINACLRHELRNYQPGPGKTTARDLSKSLSPRSEEKAKQLILEYAKKEGGAEKGIDLLDIDSGRWSTSQASVFGDQFDEASVDESVHHKNNNNKFFGKLIRVIRGKPSPNPPHPIRSHSRNPSLGRSGSGGDDMISFNDSYNAVQRPRTSTGGSSSKRSLDSSQRLSHRHSDNADFYKQLDSIADVGGDGDTGSRSSSRVRGAGIAMGMGVGPAVSAEFCYALMRDWLVDSGTSVSAADALCRLNHVELRGKSIRIMWCQKDPILRKNGSGNLFVKNLDLGVRDVRLEEVFGGLEGFFLFDSEESSKEAICGLDGSMLDGKKLIVTKFVKKSERKEPEFTNVYVKNLDEDYSESSLKEKFSEYGKVTSAVIMNDTKGKSRGFGFVNFESHTDAKMAIEALNDAEIGSKKWFVGKAMMKAARDMFLQRKAGSQPNPNASNLFVRNLATSVNAEDLKKVFGAFGRVIFAKVMCYKNGVSKGIGYICFSNPQEAKKAMDFLNGDYLVYVFLVCIFEQKEPLTKCGLQKIPKVEKFEVKVEKDDVANEASILDDDHDGASKDDECLTNSDW
ncbi:hypothetical protein OSB04_004406 [Centaurea solstitialis]|uniref:RRM domain-containing protein n=1 Tax=Centaurea solstitialis TaxID=347529 RepID=A0AA38TWR9_9ASTR|nr:hypothetical protein OSB04_004406 [Centaurea solstitialis]